LATLRYHLMPAPRAALVVACVRVVLVVHRRLTVHKGRDRQIALVAQQVALRLAGVFVHLAGEAHLSPEDSPRYLHALLIGVLFGRVGSGAPPPPSAAVPHQDQQADHRGADLPRRGDTARCARLRTDCHRLCLSSLLVSFLCPQWSRHHPGGEGDCVTASLRPPAVNLHPGGVALPSPVAADRCQSYHSKKRESNDPRLSITVCPGQSRERDSLRAALGS